MSLRSAAVLAVALSLAAGLRASVIFFDKQDNHRQITDKSIQANRSKESSLGPKKRRIAGKIPMPEQKIYTGVFDAEIVKGRTNFEKAVGSDVAVIAFYQSWDKKGVFPKRLAEEVVKAKKVLMVTWEPWRASRSDWDQPEFRLSTIAGGKHDPYVRQWLSDARDLRAPIFVRFAHEMNGDWYPWGKQANSPQEYVAAWRHIVDLSRELGADNITWVWSPNEVTGSETLDPYYPGNDYVDWIGVSGFNWGGLERWQGWRSYSQIFGPTFEQIKKYNKPIAIAEISSIENPRAGQQSKAAWITETLAAVKTSEPKVSMLIWFNGTFETNNKLYDWTIDGSPAAAQAMKDGLSDPVFTGRIIK